MVTFGTSRTRSAGRPRAPVNTTVIEPISGWVPLRVQELWAYRELVFFFVWRDVKVRYKDTTLGIVWAVLPPLATMAVFTVFFGRLAAIPSDGVPYPLFILTALVPWAVFEYAIAHASLSVLNSQALITKVYFPRLTIPVATVVSGLVDFVATFAVLLGLMRWYDVAPTLRLLWMPALLMLVLMIALGAALWLAAATIRFPDIRHVLPLLARVWLLATPIAYPSSLVDASWRTLYTMNPLVGIVDGFRWALLGVGAHPAPLLVVSAAIALSVLVTGAFYFRRVEATFADVI